MRLAESTIFSQQYTRKKGNSQQQTQLVKKKSSPCQKNPGRRGIHLL